MAKGSASTATKVEEKGRLNKRDERTQKGGSPPKKKRKEGDGNTEAETSGRNAENLWKRGSRPL